MPDVTQHTCEEVIQSHLESRVAHLDEMFRYIDSDDDDDRETASERLYELPLDIEEMETWKVLLSTGGPADWFEVTLKRDGPIDVDIVRIDYVFQDWFDGARRTLQDDERDTAERFARHLTADFYRES